MAAGGRARATPRLVAELAAGRTVAEAAAACGCSERTAYRRLTRPEVRAAIAAARQEAYTRAVGALADATTEAVATLRTALAAAAEGVRVRAAVAVLELATRGLETVELAARLDRLERQAAAAPEGWAGPRVVG